MVGRGMDTGPLAPDGQQPAAMKQAMGGGKEKRGPARAGAAVGHGQPGNRE